MFLLSRDAIKMAIMAEKCLNILSRVLARAVGKKMCHYPRDLWSSGMIPLLNQNLPISTKANVIQITAENINLLYVGHIMYYHAGGWSLEDHLFLILSRI